MSHPFSPRRTYENICDTLLRTPSSLFARNSTSAPSHETPLSPPISSKGQNIVKQRVVTTSPHSSTSGAHDHHTWPLRGGREVDMRANRYYWPRSQSRHRKGANVFSDERGGAAGPGWKSWSSGKSTLLRWSRCKMCKNRPCYKRWRDWIRVSGQ